MRKFTQFVDIPDAFRGSCIALGNFDGLHAGHRAVIDKARQAAQRSGAPLAVLMFDPPPRAFFQPDAEPYRLMSLDRRMQILEGLGVDLVFAIAFDGVIASMSDAEFCQIVLHDGLGARAVAVGFDFRFGKGRAGDVQTLGVHGLRLGFEVGIADAVGDKDDKASSTAIRNHLKSGDVATATQILGDYWRIEAVVEAGEKRGRTIGFPTANMKLGAFLHPAHGVYAVWARIVGDEAGEEIWRSGVANFGRTPTTGLRDPLLEVCLFDFEGDLYGKTLEVAFVAFQRPEAHYDSLDDMVVQIGRDAENARAILADSPKPAD